MTSIFSVSCSYGLIIPTQLIDYRRNNLILAVLTIRVVRESGAISVYLPLKWFGRSIFRQLNAWIGLALLFIFFTLGFITYYNYYHLIQIREQELLNYRTQKVRDDLQQTLEQFKRETVSLYNTRTSNVSQGLNRYFLPPNIPSPDEASKQYEQLMDIRNYLTTVLNRNPNVVDISFYRLTDKQTFRVGQLDPNYSIDDSFFIGLPRTFQFPFIGTMNMKQLGSTEKPYLYIVSPIFDIEAIKDNKVYGYFTIVLNPQLFYRYFQNGHGSDGRLMVYHENKLLLDSHKLDAKPQTAKTDGQLVSETSLKDYGIKIVGMESKNDVRSTLTKIQLTISAILLFTWLICLFVISSIQRFMTRRMNLLLAHFKKMQMDPFVEPLTDNGKDEISFLVNRFNQLTSQLQEYINRITSVTLQKHNAEFYALKMQINPHFLFNTLESLRMQAISQKHVSLGDKLYILGKLFRWILKSDKEIIPIAEELQFVENYLDLYNLGKSNRIELEVSSALDLTRYDMLKFSFQPIIENAIQHGELDKMEEPLIRIRVYNEHQYQYIEILNNGLSASAETIAWLSKDLEMPYEIMRDNHLGLKNVHERIRSYYGADYGLHIIPAEDGFSFGVMIRLPLTPSSGL